jgi:hypothetical protein
MAALTPDYAQVEAAVVEMTNAYRRENKLGLVKINPKLSAAARAYANLLAKTQEFSHTAGGTNAGDRIRKAGYDFCSYGENLAMAADSRGFASRPLASSAVTGWINSPGHHANLVAPGVTEIGVGVALVPYRYPKYVTVQVFGQPQSAAIEFQISNTLKDKVSYSFGGKSQSIDPSYAITHTTCASGKIVFQKIGGLLGKSINASFDAADGRVYVLKPDAAAGLKVTVEKRRKIE